MNVQNDIVIYMCGIGLIFGLLACSHKTTNNQTKKQIIIVNMTRDMVEIHQENLKIEQEFMRLNPNIKVININVPNRSYWTKLLTMIAAGNPPDMILLDTEQFPKFVKRGYLLDLTPYLEKDREIEIDDYFPEAVRRSSYQKKIFGIPTDTAIALPFYNCDIFDQVGIPYPSEHWSWDDYLRIAKKLTRDIDDDGKIDIYGSGGVPWIQYTFSQGGHFVDNPINPTKCTIDDQIVMNAIQWVADLRLVHKVSPDPAQLAYETVDDMFVAGKIAMNINGHWLVPKYRAIKKFRWNVASMPTGKVGKAAINFGSCYAIPAGTKHPDAAWKLLKFYASIPIAKRFVSFGYFTPANKLIAYSPEFLNSGLPPANEKAFLEAMHYTVSYPFFEKNSEMIDMFNSELQSIFIGTKKAKDVCPQLAKQINQRIFNRGE
ncbi:MAG: sugar ABC transporter substrate-binding protein [bacterium]|nr:sugar ABC transporter substrate-binding protein [bacterium]